METIVPYKVMCYDQTAILNPSNKVAKAANGSVIDAVGETVLSFVFGTHTFQVKAIITRDIDEVLLGYDILSDHECLWDFNHKRIIIDGEFFPTITQGRKQWGGRGDASPPEFGVGGR